MSDRDDVDDSMGRVRATLRVIAEDQGTLVIASALGAAADALRGMRRYLADVTVDPREFLPLVELVDELRAMLLPLGLRRQPAFSDLIETRSGPESLYQT